jgi:hypothetical protein
LGNILGVLNKLCFFVRTGCLEFSRKGAGHWKLDLPFVVCDAFADNGVDTGNALCKLEGSVTELLQPTCSR